MRKDLLQPYLERILRRSGIRPSSRPNSGRESEDDKLGILDFIHFSQDKKCFRKLAFCDVETGEQYTDLMEMYVLELQKLPPEDLNEKGIIRWMRFLGGKNREKFEDMAKKDEYIEERIMN